MGANPETNKPSALLPAFEKNEDPRKQLLSHAPTLVTLILLLAVTLCAWAIANENLKFQSQIVFEDEASRISQEIRNQIRYHIHILNDGATLFAASRSVERNEWAAFARQQERSGLNSGIKALSFIEVVPMEEKQTFIASVREDRTLSPEGFPNFNIQTTNNLPVLYVLKYLEPLTQREHLLGFDFQSDPARKEALDLARDQGQAVVSRKLVPSEMTPGVDFLLVLPILSKWFVDQQRQRATECSPRVCHPGYQFRGIFLGNVSEPLAEIAHFISGI